MGSEHPGQQRLLSTHSLTASDTNNRHFVSVSGGQQSWSTFVDLPVFFTGLQSKFSKYGLQGTGAEDLLLNSRSCQSKTSVHFHVGLGGR